MSHEALVGKIFNYRPKKGRAWVMLPNEISDDSAVLKPLFDDPDWWLQEKKDGKRCLVQIADQNIQLISRQGKPLRCPDRVLRHALEGTGFPATLDGELVGPDANGAYCYWVFDCLSLEGVDLAAKPLRERVAIVDAATKRVSSTRVRTLPWFRAPAEKSKEAARLFDGGREGYVLKHQGTPYVLGRPPRGGPWIKFKFVSECTVRSGGPIGETPVSYSFQMQVLHEGEWVLCGHCAVPWNAGYDVHRQFAEGTLWEVRYLYATSDHILYQPRIKSPRDDVDEAAVSRSQFRYRG